MATYKKEKKNKYASSDEVIFVQNGEHHNNYAETFI
jgi:hypothetical protein